jgi:hypothetical protein
MLFCVIKSLQLRNLFILWGLERLFNILDPRAQMLVIDLISFHLCNVEARRKAVVCTKPFWSLRSFWIYIAGEVDFWWFWMIL